MEDIFAEINADCWSIRRQINDHVHRVNRAIVFGHNDNASSYQVVVVGESTARDCGKIFLDSSTDTLKFVALATGVKVDKVEARLGEAILLKVGSVIEFGEDARDVFDVLRGADVSYGCDLVHEAHGSIATQVGPVYDGGGHPDQKRARAIALPTQRYDSNFLSKENTELKLNCRICKFRAWNMYAINFHYQREHRNHIHTQTVPLLAYIIYYPKYHTVVRYDQSEFEVKFLSNNNYYGNLRYLLSHGPAQKPWICPATVRAVEALNMRDCSNAVRNMMYRGDVDEEFKRVAGFSFEPFFWGTNELADRKLKIKLKRADSSDHVPTAFYKNRFRIYMIAPVRYIKGVDPVYLGITQGPGDNRPYSHMYSFRSDMRSFIAEGCCFCYLFECGFTSDEFTRVKSAILQPISIEPYCTICSRNSTRRNENQEQLLVFICNSTIFSV